MVDKGGMGYVIRWPKPEERGFFMYHYVLLHELGHHHDYRYRHKKRMPSGTANAEASADAHVARLTSVPTLSE